VVDAAWGRLALVDRGIERGQRQANVDDIAPLPERLKVVLAHQPGI
jgi:hypothetical protein